MFQKANVIFLEAPAGVGFSYSSNDNVSTDDDFVHDLFILIMMIS